MSERNWIAEQIELVRQRAREQGHELTPLQEGMVAAIAARDPRHEPHSAEDLAAIQKALREHGKWSGPEEWRIMTWFDNEISETTRDNAPWFVVAVECDGQRFACGCPTLEGAYAFMRLYQKLIIEQFYSVGPPWAAARLYRS